MRDEVTAWGCDVPISAPEPLINPYYCNVDFGGFGFGPGGIAHNFTEADYEAYMTPYYAPLATAESVPYE